MVSVVIFFGTFLVFIVSAIFILGLILKDTHFLDDDISEEIHKLIQEQQRRRDEKKN